MMIEKYMSKELVVVSPGDTIAHVRNLLISNRVSRVLIAQEGLVGIVTKKDISERLATGSALWRRRPIDKISVSRVMTTDLITISSDASIAEAAKMMIENKISSLPVIDDKGNLVGIITKTDLVKAYLENYRGKYKVRKLMSKNVVTVDRFHTLSHVVELMREKGVGRVIVIDGGKPVGIITPSNISFYELTEPRRGVRVMEKTFVRKPDRAERPRYRYVKTLLVTAEDLMSSNLITIKSTRDATEAADLLIKNKISSLPVVDDTELSGIITKTDIVRGIAKIG